MKYKRFQKKAAEYIHSSAFITAFKKFSSKVSDGLSGSAVVSMPLSVMKRDFTSKSVAGRALSSLFSSFTKSSGKKLADRIRGSLTFRASRVLSYAIKEVTVREFFAFFATLCGVGGIINLLAYGTSPKEILLFAGFAICASVVIFGGTFVRNSLLNVVSESAIVKSICELLDVDIREVPEEKNKTHRDASAFFMIAGILAGFGFGFFSLIYAVICTFGIFGLIAILIWPQLGILTMVITATFIPTLAEAGIAVYTLLCMLARKLLKQEKVLFDVSFIFAVAFSIILLISAILSFTPLQSLLVAVLQMAFISTYLTAYNLTTKKKFLDSLIKMFTVSAGLCALYGIYQFFYGGVNTTWVDTEMFKDLKFRVYSTFLNPNVYAEFLVIAIPVSAAAVFRSRKTSHRMIYSGIGALLIVNLLLTYSRGGYLALILAALIFVLAVEKRILLLGFAGLFASPFILPQSIIERFSSIGNISDSSTSYRYMIWQGTAKMLKDYWAMGVGLGYDAFNSVYPMYSFSTIVAPHSHNLYLQIAVETGIWGLIIFFGFGIFYFCRVLSCSTKMLPVSERAIFAAFAAAMAAFLLIGLFDFVWYNYRLVLLFWLLCGVSSAAVHIYREGS